MKHLILAIALLGAAAGVLAATPTATLSWTPATTRADGTLLTGASYFAVYAGASGAEVLLRTGIAASPIVIAGVLGQTTCFQVTQIETATGLESERSAEVCKTFATPIPPAPPTGVAVK